MFFSRQKILKKYQSGSYSFNNPTRGATFSLQFISLCNFLMQTPFFAMIKLHIIHPHSILKYILQYLHFHEYMYLISQIEQTFFYFDFQLFYGILFDKILSFIHVHYRLRTFYKHFPIQLFFSSKNAIKLASCKHEREKKILTAENNHELQSEITIVLTCFIYENLKRAT